MKSVSNMMKLSTTLRSGSIGTGADEGAGAAEHRGVGQRDQKLGRRQRHAAGERDHDGDKDDDDRGVVNPGRDEGHQHNQQKYHGPVGKMRGVVESSGEAVEGTFATGANVRADATVDAIRQFLKEMDNYRNSGPTPVELAYMRSAVSQQDALSYETLGQKAGFLLQMIMYDLKPDYVQAQNNLIKTVSPETLKASAARWLDPAEMVIVVVGDKQKLEKPLKELHLPIYPLQLP